MSDEIKKGKKKCEHTFGRIWLASKGYQEGKFCTKCLELKSGSQKPEQK